MSCLLHYKTAVFPHLITPRAGCVKERAGTVFFTGEEFTFVSWAVRRTVGAFALIMVVNEITCIIFRILTEPILGVFVLLPAWQSEEVRAVAVAFVTAPLPYIQFAIAIPVGAATASDTFVVEKK